MARRRTFDPAWLLERLIHDLLNRCLMPVRPISAQFLYFVRRFPDYIMGIVVLYVFTFALALPYLCSNMVYSAYFSPDMDNNGLIKKATDLNDQRIKEADKYLSTLSRSGNKAYYSELMSREHIDLVIAVVTTKRQVRGDMKLNYLTQVMAKLDTVIKNDQSFPNKVLFTCNVFPGPGNNTEAYNVGQYFPLFNRFPKESPASTIMNPFEKEKEDYIFCLQRALNYHPKYIIMIEDDAVPNDDMLRTIKKVLDGERDPYLNVKRSLDSNTWSYLKLFYPERWQGYSYDNGVGVIEQLSLSFIGGFVFLSAFHFHLAKCKNSRVHRHKPDEYFVFAIGFMYFGIFANVVGRQYWLRFLQSFSHYHTVIAPNCCSPAILYETAMAQDIISYLASITCDANNPVDLAMARYTYENELYSILVEPSLVKHIGMISSIKSTIRFPEDFTF